MHIRNALLAMIISVLSAFPARAAEPLHIAYFSGSARSKIGALIMVEVYKRANIDTVAMSMPGARNAPSAEASLVVGESVRVYSYADAHPTLTRVEPAVTEWTTVAFYRDDASINLAGPSDMRNFRVGYVRGTRAAEDVIAEQRLTNVEGVDTPETLFKMLNARRFPVALDGGTNGAYWIRKGDYPHIAKLEINKIPLYHFLSPKYRELAPVLSQTIKQLRASGELAKIAARAEEAVMESGIN